MLNTAFTPLGATDVSAASFGGAASYFAADENYGTCALVDPADTVFISPWAPQTTVAVADACALSFTCFIEEDFTQSVATPRWFEANGDALFYLTLQAQSPDRLFEASALATDTSTPPKNLDPYNLEISLQTNVPVKFSPNNAGQGGPGFVPSTVDLHIDYYQFSPTEKRIIDASVTLDNYQAVAPTLNGSYVLTIETVALPWFDLLNKFAFPIPFYLALFVGIGAMLDAVTGAYYVVMRLFTRLREPGPFHYMAFVQLIVPEQIFGCGLGVLVFGLSEKMITFTFAHASRSRPPAPACLLRRRLQPLLLPLLLPLLPLPMLMLILMLILMLPSATSAWCNGRGCCAAICGCMRARLTGAVCAYGAALCRLGFSRSSPQTSTTAIRRYRTPSPFKVAWRWRLPRAASTFYTAPPASSSLTAGTKTKTARATRRACSRTRLVAAWAVAAPRRRCRISGAGGGGIAQCGRDGSARQHVPAGQGVEPAGCK